MADALAGCPRLAVTTSLAGRTMAPRRPRGKIRVGGFGGATGLADYIRGHGIDMVIDATHPYAATISTHAAEACLVASRPLLRFERQAWQPRKGDRWIVVDSLSAAARIAPELGRRAFLTIGAKELAAFATSTNVWFLVRLVEQPSDPVPLPNFELLLERGPFEMAAERQLMSQLRIDLLIAKNSGGEATYAKMAAARELGLPVLLLRRPRLPPAETAGTIADAIAWAKEKAR